VLGNFYLGLNKPLVPTRLFTSEEEAQAWLRSFLPEARDVARSVSSAP
jgi:hypothetical protein